MSKSLLLITCVLCTLLLLGCYKSDTSTNGAAPTNKPAPAASSPAPAATASSGQKIGVAECDAFLTAYEACVTDKVPAAQRAQFNASLAQVCKQSHDQAKQSMKAYGCTF